MPGWNLEQIRKSRVLVVGAGALGNEVLKNLALIGVGEIYLVDFDKVEAGNLSRSVLFRQGDVGQFKAEVAAKCLAELNPEVRVRYLVGDVMHDIGLGLFRRMDAIIGCVDNRLARLWLNRWAFRAGKPWVSGGILQFSGQVAVYAPGKSCYECGLSKAGWQDVKARMGCTDLAQRYVAQGVAPTTAISASVIGAWQVQEALSLALGRSEHAGSLWSFEGLRRHAETYDLLPPKVDCFGNHPYAPVEEMAELSAEMELGEVLEVLEGRFGDGLWIELDHAVGTELATMSSKERHAVLVPLPDLSEEVADAYRSIAGEGVGVPQGKLFSRLDKTFAKQGARLVDLGIPHWHVLRIGSPSGQFFVELGRDKEAILEGMFWPRKKNRREERGSLP